MSETFSNNLINSSIFHLLNFERYSNFPQAARAAATANQFQIVLLSDDFNTLFAVETRQQTSVEEAVLASFTNGIDRDRKGSRIDVGGITTYWGPVTVMGRKYYLLLVDNDSNYTQDEMVRLADIIELAMGMWNYVPARDPSSEFIRALRRGNRDLSHTLSGELKLIESDIAAIFIVSGAKKKDSLKVLAEFQAGRKLSTIVSTDNEEIAGIVLRNPESKRPDVEAWEQFSQKMKEAGATKTYYVGQLNNVDDACSAYRLVSETEAFLPYVFPYKTLYTRYDMTFAANCITVCRSGGQVKKNYLGLVKPFVNAHDLKTKQLKDTLECFMLDASLSTSKTAEILNVHVNTVQYRLKRVKEILGVDVASSDIAPSMMFALAVLRIENFALTV